MAMEAKSYRSLPLEQELLSSLFPNSRNVDLLAAYYLNLVLLTTKTSDDLEIINYLDLLFSKTLA